MEGAFKKFACGHKRPKKKNVHVTWKAKLKMCKSHGKQEKKNAYNMKLQCTNFLTWKLEYMQNKGKQKFQVPI